MSRLRKLFDTTGLYEKNLLKPEDVPYLLSNNWHRADLHIHTSYSNDVLPSKSLDPLTLYRKARKKGLRYISFTDHDTMDAYDRVGWEREGLVPGVEIKIRDRVRVGHTLHINVYELNKEQFKELNEIAKKERNLEKFLAYLKQHDLPFVYNHPFWFAHRERPNHRAIDRLMPLFPVVEYNMHRVKQKNSLTVKMAAKHKKGIMAATDTHIGDIGKAYTVAQGETFREFYNNIRDGKAYIMPQDLTLNALKNETNAWIDLIFNLDVNPTKKNHYTGIRPVDALINMGTRGTLTTSRRLKKPARKVVTTLNKSGAPAICYIKFQHLLAFRDIRQLKLANIL